MTKTFLMFPLIISTNNLTNNLTQMYEAILKAVICYISQLK